MALAPGTRLGPYEIVAPIGSGGMGEVYRARDTRLGREVAIKMLPPALVTDTDRLRRFEQEARAASILNHPNILAIHDIGTTEDGSPYVVSELLVGSTLRERLLAGPLPSRKTLDTSIQIASGLAAAHEMGIVHRDLKPDNIFLTEDGRVKIFDFGLAKLSNPRMRDTQSGPVPTAIAETEPGVLMGTVSYMSPEQIRGTRTDQRSDIFSFGSILYEMLTGEPAFKGDSAVEIMHAILKDEPPDLSESNPGLSPEFESVVRHCLEKNPQERYQSARDVGFNLEALAHISGRSGILRTHLPRFTRSRRLPLLLGIAILLGLVSLLSLWIGMRSRHDEPPSFQQLTFRRGRIFSARFAPDGESVVYGAAFDDRPVEVFSARPGTPEGRSLNLPSADILGLSRTGEMAIQIAPRNGLGVLAQAPLGGGAPRELADQVRWADWSVDGKLALVRWIDGKNRLECPLGKVIYETSNLLSTMRFSPDGTRIALFEKPTGVATTWSILLVDLRGQRWVLSEGWNEKIGLAWTPSGEEILFVASKEAQARDLHAVSPEGKHRLVMRLPVSFELHDIAKDGTLLVSTEFVSTSTVGLFHGETRERNLSWLDNSQASDLSPDGRTLVLTERGVAGGPNHSVYLRTTEPSPAVKIGDGAGVNLSPDGRFVIVIERASPPRLMILPTGRGVPATLVNQNIDDYNWADWLPDGQRIVFSGSERGRGVRLYVQDVSGGAAKPITPEGVFIASGGDVVSPDGKYVAAFNSDRKVFLQPIDDGQLIPITGASAGELPIQWSADGKGIYVYRRGELPARVFLIDIASNRRTAWAEIAPADPSGVTAIANLKITPDGKSHVYTYTRVLSELYAVENVID